MKRGQLPRAVSLLAFPGLLLVSLLGFSTVEAQDQRPFLGSAFRIQYASGQKIFQVYSPAPAGKLEVASGGGVSTPSVLAYAERQPAFGKSRLRLRPRLVTRIR